MIVGAGGNIAVQTGDDGVVVVDSGSAANADKVLATIRRLSPAPIRYIINTSADADHVGGNDRLARAGQSVMPAIGLTGGGINIGAALNNGGSASILATENALARMSAPTGKESAFPASAWPTDTFSEPQKDFYLNGEAIISYLTPAAHTDGDSIVYFRRSDVVVAGEVLDMTRWPMIDRARGGSTQGLLNALNHIIEITVPALPLYWQEGGTYVVPGKGRLCDEADVVEYRDMITIIRDVIEDMMKKGMTLEQIQKADPTKDYRPRYGTDSGPWTTAMFVEAIYRDLTAGAQQARGTR